MMNLENELSACDLEKIQLIGEVQDNGAFIAVGTPDLRVQLLSENVGEILHLSNFKFDQQVGLPLKDILPDELFDEVEMRIKKRSNRITTESFEVTADQNYDVFLFALGEDRVGIEISLKEVSIQREDPALQPEALLRSFLKDLGEGKEVVDYGKTICRYIRKITGLDRVMLYRFGPEWHGDVLAEDRAASIHSFLNHKFPATDIPKPARELYLRNEVRLILDANSTGSPIFPKVDARTRSTVDLTDSRLRAVSNVHLEYLKNMGVTTSFSVALILDGALWGLIACHGRKRTYIPHSVRTLCQSFAEAVALLAGRLEREKQKDGELQFLTRSIKLFRDLQGNSDPRADLLKNFAAVNQLFQSTGIALVTQDKIDIAGLTPTISTTKQIAKALKAKLKEDQKSVVAVRSLRELNPEWENISSVASGVLAIELPSLEQSLILIFRPEYVQTIAWGGDPRKSLTARNYGGTINPRASFESWNETIRHQSLPWLDFEIAGLDTFKILFFDALIQYQGLIQELIQKNRAKA